MEITNPKIMLKKSVLLLLVLSFQCINAQIKLTHNIGETPIETSMLSCEEDESWSRVFKLSDFGVTTNEQFIISSGQVAFSKSYGGAYLQYSISSVDADFPNSVPKFLASSSYIDLPIINGSPELIEFEFDTPVVVPAGVERILVKV